MTDVIKSPAPIQTYRGDLFNHVVSTLRNGHTQDELSRELNELVNACRETCKVGELTIKIKVRPDKAGNGQYSLEDDYSCKKPKPERGSTFYFGTPEGNLQRDDPAQQNLNLRQVEEQIAEAKTLSEEPTPLKKVD